jgi:hypothetical protein
MKLFSRLLYCCIIVLLTCCAPEDNPVDASQSKTNTTEVQVKNWYVAYKAKNRFNPLLSKLNLQWDQARTIELKDGTTAIAVPVIASEQNPNYLGKKLAYFYPKSNGKGFSVTLWELLPSTKQQSVSFEAVANNTFEGYILKWDFVDGFIEGAKFSQGVYLFDILLQTDDSYKNNHPKPKTARVDEDQDGVIVINNYKRWIRRENNYQRSEGSSSEYVGGGGGGGGGSASEEQEEEKDPCEKLKILKDDSKHKNALAELKKNFKLQYETGYYISQSTGYVAGTPDSNLALTGTRYSDTYGIMHVHEDTYTHQVNNGGIRPEIVTPIHMFSPKDVYTFCSLLITANKYKTSTLDEVFNEMVSSSGTYQLRFEGDINNVKNFNYDDLEQKYIAHMKDYKDDLESGFLSFMKEYIGINGITLYKINEDGTSESKTLSANNQLTTNPC